MHHLVNKSLIISRCTVYMQKKKIIKRCLVKVMLLTSHVKKIGTGEMLHKIKPPKSQKLLRLEYSASSKHIFFHSPRISFLSP